MHKTLNELKHLRILNVYEKEVNGVRQNTKGKKKIATKILRPTKGRRRKKNRSHKKCVRNKKKESTKIKEHFRGSY